MFNSKRKGLSLVECIILIIVTLVTLGAIFATMGLAHKNYAAGKLDRDSREVLFSWIQTFESLWPTPAIMNNPANVHNESLLQAEANSIIQQTGSMLGTYASGVTTIGSFTVEAEPGALSNGSMVLHIEISGGGKKIVDLFRRYNVYTTETVSDDILVPVGS